MWVKHIYTGFKFFVTKGGKKNLQEPAGTGCHNQHSLSNSATESNVSYILEKKTGLHIEK